MTEIRFTYRQIRATQTINREGGLIWMGPHHFKRIDNLAHRGHTAAALSRALAAYRSRAAGPSRLEQEFNTVTAWCAAELRDQVNWAYEGLHTLVIHDDQDAAAFRLRWC